MKTTFLSLCVVIIALVVMDITKPLKVKQGQKYKLRTGQIVTVTLVEKDLVIFKDGTRSVCWELESFKENAKNLD